MPVEWDRENGGTIETVEGHPGVWRAADMMATEHDVSVFIGHLVKMMKPRTAIETGCYYGQTTAQIAIMLEKGDTLYTCDTSEDCVNAVRITVPMDNVICTLQTGVSLAKSVPNVDFAFLDSGGDRVEEAKALQMSEHGIIALHDAHRPAFDKIVKLGYRHIKFYTPRGLALFQKVSG